jgi:hypothetical protein
MSLPLIEVPIVGYGDDEQAMQAYRAEGTRRALAMDNRGPIRFDANGDVAADIIDSYRTHGFYVFTGVLGAEELADIEADVAMILDRAPVTKDATVDQHGKPALDADRSSKSYGFVRPLSDPVGGTDASYGRHPVKMNEPEPPAGAPEYVVQIVSGSLQYSEACLRVYGHHDLLKVAEALNGRDFTPFNEVVWIKHPGLGGSVAWHQDGWTHWDNPELDDGTHGFNYMVQLYGCDAANGLWVVPGSHTVGKADIKAMVDAAGSDRLPDAVPIICDPGDVAITNRQAIHGSFANTSSKPRVTVNFGFHRRRSVAGVTSGGVHNPVSEYTDDYIHQRSKCIAWGIDARVQRFPDEQRYVYAPLADHEDELRWDDAARAEIRDYNLRDLGI